MFGYFSIILYHLKRCGTIHTSIVHTNIFNPVDLSVTIFHYCEDGIAITQFQTSKIFQLLKNIARNELFDYTLSSTTNI